MAKSTHKLAAIMFTDIVGYTRLMGDDETRAMAILKKNKEIHRTQIQNYNGRLLKEMGDGMLASFRSILDAIYCSVRISEEAESAGYPLKIGIHLGEIIFDQGDVYGDGVNIASRIQETCTTGEIRVSKTVHANIENKSGISTEFIEERELKNINHPIPIYTISVDPESLPMSTAPFFRPQHRRRLVNILMLLIVPALAYFSYKQFVQTGRGSQFTPASLGKSIAVLPFETLGKDAEIKYLADGIRMEITNHLSKISELRINSSRTLAERYRDRSLEASLLLNELRVLYILDGTFQEEEDQVKLIVQLTNTLDGRVIWSENFSSDWGNMLSVQSEIADAVVDELQVIITPNEKRVIQKIPNYNPQAYKLYLRGLGLMMAYWLDRTDTSTVYTADSLFSLALEIDSVFAPGYHGRAEVFDALNIGDSVLHFCKKAIEIDSTLAEAFELLAFAEMRYPWGTYERGVELINEAVALNPGLEMAFWTRGINYLRLRNPIEAMRDFLKSENMTRGTFYHYRRLYDIGLLYLWLEDYRRAEKYLLLSRKMRKDQYESCQALARLYQNQGKFDKARLYADTVKASENFYNLGGRYVFSEMVLQSVMEDFEGAHKTLLDLLNRWQVELTPHPSGHSTEGFIYWKVGETSDAMERFNSYIEWNEGLGEENYDRMVGLAGVYSFLGRKQDALSALKKYSKETRWLENRISPVGWLDLVQIHPMYQNLWNEEEFKEIIEEGKTFKAAVRARIEQMIQVEGFDVY